MGRSKKKAKCGRFGKWRSKRKEVGQSGDVCHQIITGQLQMLKAPALFQHEAEFTRRGSGITTAQRKPKQLLNISHHVAAFGLPLFKETVLVNV